MAARHVHIAEIHVARQKEIIEELRRDGHPTLDAELLLQVFQQTLRSHKESLLRLRGS